MKKLLTKMRFNKCLVILLLKIESKYKINLIFQTTRDNAATLQNDYNLVAALCNYSATFQKHCMCNKENTCYITMLQCQFFFQTCQNYMVRLTGYLLFPFSKMQFYVQAFNIIRKSYSSKISLRFVFDQFKGRQETVH